MTCYRKGGCGPYEMRSCYECPASKPEYLTRENARLPTVEEYRESANKFAFQFASPWSEPKYRCPKCGGGMCRNNMITLTTYPAQYEYLCDKCGHKEYQYM